MTSFDLRLSIIFQCEPQTERRERKGDPEIYRERNEKETEKEEERDREKKREERKKERETEIER